MKVRCDSFQKIGILHSAPVWAMKISSVASRSQLLTTAFINSDEKTALIVMNQCDKKLTYNLCIGGCATVVNILPHAIQTLVL